MEQDSKRPEREIFEHCLGLPSDQRSAYLQGACRHDTELELRIRRLLAAHEETDDSTDLGFLPPSVTEEDPESIGPYRILQRIGEGGMGVVYMAQQTTPVQRRVALKVVRLGMDTKEVIGRFNSERQALALMTHPNIASILDAGATTNGRPYFVMEYVAGVSIIEACDRGLRSIDDRLRLFVRVCRAVKHAHGRGIVHRDLKPSNVLVTEEDGHLFPKIIDFGIAKAMNQRLGDLTVYTGQGQLIGTLEYMSPEQAGPAHIGVDARSDIYSLGVILYELLTGTRPFEFRESKRDYAEIQRIICEEIPDKPSRRVRKIGGFSPGLARNRACTPAHLARELEGELDWLAMRALAKKPNERYQSALELAEETERFLEGAPLKVGPPGVFYRVRRFARRNARFSSLGAAIAWGLSFVVLSVLMIFWMSRSTGDAPQLRLAVTLPAGERLSHFYRHGFSLSPDGMTLAFVSGSVENPYVFPVRTRILLRRLDQWNPTQVEQTDNGCQPFFSPDGQWLGFTYFDDADNKWFLKKVEIASGEAVTLCECEARWGVSWGEDGWIVFGQEGDGLYRVSDRGGVPEQITSLNGDFGDVSHRLPHHLPGSRAVLFTSPDQREASGQEARIFVHSFDEEEPRLLIEDGWDARYLQSGHLLFARGGDLMSVPFDPSRQVVTGPEAPVLQGITHSLNTVNPVLRTGAIQLSVSASGVMAYTPGSVFPEIKDSLVWVDQSGNEEPIPAPRRNYLTVRVSEDGNRLLLTTVYPPQDVFLYDRQRDRLRRQTFEGSNIYATFGPGPDRFTFSSNRSGPRQLYIKGLDSGPGTAQVMPTETEGFARPGFWSASTGKLTIVSPGSETRFDIWTLSGDGKSEPFLRSRFSEQYPELSPDGKWMVHTSNESGRPEVYIRPYPAPGKVLQISKGGGIQPAWSRDGKRVFFRWRGKFLAVSLTIAGDELRAGEPRLLFEGNYGNVVPIRSYDVGPDGRFLLIKRPEPDTVQATIDQFFPDRIQIVQNWKVEQPDGSHKDE